jgi:hypothetical protein
MEVAYGIKVRNLATVTEQRSATRKWRPMAIAKALSTGQRASIGFWKPFNEPLEGDRPGCDFSQLNLMSSSPSHSARWGSPSLAWGRLGHVPIPHRDPSRLCLNASPASIQSVWGIARSGAEPA